MNKIEDFLKYNGFKDITKKIPIDFHEQFGSGFGIVYVLSKRYTRIKDEMFTEVKVGDGGGHINIFAICYYKEKYSSFELHLPDYMILDEFTYYLNACEQHVKSLCKPKDELKLNTALDKAANGTLKDWLESQKDIETPLDKENEKMDKETKNMEHYWPCVHIKEEDNTSPNGYRRVSYDITTFNTEQLSELNSFIMAINDHFPKIKMWMTGERWENENQTLTREIGNSTEDKDTETNKRIKKLVEENKELYKKMHEDGLSLAVSFPT